MNEIYEIVVRLAEFVPRVWKEAFLIFLVIELLKVNGVLKKETWIQFSNILGAFLLNGAKLPSSDPQALRISMTMVVAALMFQVFKFAKNKGLPLIKKGLSQLGN